MTSSRPVICILDGSADVSGAFVAARREAQLMGAEADFILLKSEESRIGSEQAAGFARIYSVPVKSLQRSARSALGYLPSLLRCSLAIRSILARENCQRLQFNDFHFAHGGVLRALGYRGRIVTWVRVNPERFGVVGRSWLALARRSSDRMVAVSRTVRQRMPWPQSLEVVYDPVPDVPVLGPSDEPALVLMGNYDPAKGHGAAIAAFHRIAARHPAARLLFYGSEMGLAGQQAHLTRLRAEADAGPGADRIEFRPFVQSPTEALRNARVALSLSRSESFSLVCQEASAHGLPVIATRSGGPEEIIEDGVTGYIVAVDDHEAIADRMDRLLSDADLANRLGLAGAALVRDRFPVDCFKGQLRDLFEL